MDYTLVISTPDTGRTTIACATKTDVDNQIVSFIRNNTEEAYNIDVQMND